MATSEEYAVVEAALLKAIMAEEHVVMDQIPMMLRGLIPPDAAPKAAHAAAHIALDTIDAYRARGLAANKGTDVAGRPDPKMPPGAKS